MPQIINPGESFGSRLGSSLGTSFGAGLDQLANAKLNKLMQKQQQGEYRSALESLGISPQHAEALSALPENLRQPITMNYLQNLGESAQQRPQQPVETIQSRSSGFSALQQNKIPSIKMPDRPRQENILAENIIKRQPLDQQQALTQALTQQRQPVGMQQQVAPAVQQQAPQQVPQQQLAQRQSPMQAVQPQQQISPQVQQQEPTIGEVLARGSKKQQKEIKLSKEQEKYVKAYDSASETVHILDRMEELLNSGEIKSGFIKGNLPYGTLSESEQEFSDLSAALQAQLSTSGQFGLPTNAKIKFIESLKPNLNKKEEVNRRNIDRLRKEALNSQKIAQKRLPEGVLGEAEQNPQIPRQEAVIVPEKRQPEVAKKAESDQEESWGDWFSRNLNAVHAKASGISEEQGKEFQDWLSNLTGGKSNLPEHMQKGLESERAENLKPRGLAEETIQDTLASVPTLTLGGPVKSLPKAIGRLAAGIGAANVAKEAGGGPVAQIAASIAANKGITSAKNWATGVKGKNILDIAKSASKELYDIEKDLGRNINVKAPDYVKKLDELRHEVANTTSISESEKNNFLNKIDNWFKDIKGNKGVNLSDINSKRSDFINESKKLAKKGLLGSDSIQTRSERSFRHELDNFLENAHLNASDIVKRKKEINSSLYSSERAHSKEYKDYLRRAQGIMFKEGERIGKSHPQWHKAWTDADKIERAINYRPEFLQFLEEYPKVEKYITNPIAQMILTGGSAAGAAILGKPGTALKTLAGGAAGAVGINTLKKASQVAAFALSKDPQLRSIAGKAVRAVMDRNIPAARIAFTRLNKKTAPYAGLLNSSRVQDSEETIQQ